MSTDPRAVVADEDKAAIEARVKVVGLALAEAQEALQAQVDDLQRQLAEAQEEYLLVEEQLEATQLELEQCQQALAACEAGGGGNTHERPGAHNTGVPAGTTLQIVTNHQPVAGGRYKNLDIRNVPQSKGGVHDVEYENCIFRGTDARPGGTTGLLSLIRDTHAGGFTLRRCTFRPTTPDFRWVGVHGWGVHLIACDISGVTDPMQVFRTDGKPDEDCEVIVEACYFHDQAYFAPGQGGGETSSNGSHSDDIQWQGGRGLEVMWSYFTGMLDPAYAPNYTGKPQSNAAMMIKPDAGKISGGKIHDNWLGGGAVTINIADAPSKGRFIDSLGEITRNVFYRTQQFPPTNVKINYAAGHTINASITENQMEDGSQITVTREQLK